MGHDASFAEYVELRWPLLVRLAALLVGPDAADGLTRDALLRAYRTWPDVLQAPSRDRVVKQILFDGFVERVEQAGASPAVPGGARGRVAALPPLERAVVVLRCYEELPADEIAVALGLTREETEAYAASAERRLLETEQDPTTDLAPENDPGPTDADLRGELRGQAAGVLPDLPPVDALLVAGHADRSRRTRRGWAVAGAVLAVLVGASALVTATETSPPATAGATGRPVLPTRMGQVPVGTPPRAPYVSGGVLDFGPAEVRLPQQPVALAKAGSNLVITYPGGRIELFESATTKRTVLARTSVGEPVVDTDGRWVAWRQEGMGDGTGARTGAGTGAVVVVHPLTGGRRLQRSFPVGASCCHDSFRVTGITRSGQLIASLPSAGRSWVWDLRHGTVRLLRELDGRIIRQVVGDDVVAVDLMSRSYSVTVGSVVGDRFRPSFSTDRPEPDFAVPGWIIYTGWDGTLRARSLPWAASVTQPGSRSGVGPGPGVRRREVVLRLPPYLVRTTLRRELGTTVVMDVRSARSDDVTAGYLVRCDIATGSCQNVAHLRGEHHLAR
ncbi:sigma factor-like helix-turn-helix DNA-binding protein [Marmoricola sp. RAF53]|uniref:sigma factor-like helix-turn-helix DNA-binding protein n=1 Tax=Marmoricola sp. RAF53 TaxID=3233059 RepID=UPI003F94A986